MEIKFERSLSKGLLNKDTTVFKEYLKNTTTHGVARIFRSHYSIVRRLFWLLVCIGAGIGCLYNCIDRIMLLARRPTSTTTTIRSQIPLTFPAVTICNLNYFTSAGLQSVNLRDVGSTALNIDPLDPEAVSGCKMNLSSHPESKQVTLEDLNRRASQPLSELVLSCNFQGEPCDLERDFESSILGLGTCYTFNGIRRNPSLKSYGTGSRQGLLLYLNIDQDNYVASGLQDAGIRVSVHPVSEPSQALDQGISVPPGRIAFVGIQEERIINNAMVDCVHSNHIERLNFLLNTYSYSASACLTDCLFSVIANTCSCYHSRTSLPPVNPIYDDIRNCTFSDICCIQEVVNSPMNCTCPSACETIFYDRTTSYSSFPANYVSRLYQDVLGSNLSQNLVGLSVYFRTLSVRNETTVYSYSFVALLSDIGGQLGLFLGISVVSILEFSTWLFDEGVNRLCCLRVSWRKKKEEDDESKKRKVSMSLCSLLYK